MIFYKAIRYTILEYCLGVFFDHIKLNFHKKHYDSNILDVMMGKRSSFSKIVWNGYSHFDCNILNVQEYNGSFYLSFKCAADNNTDPDIYRNQISEDGTSLIIISFKMFDLVEFIP